MRKELIRAVVIGGLIAGAVDIGAAVLISHAAPDAIMRAIARGLLGRPAMQGGAPVAAFGLVLQLAMGALIGLIYGLGCHRWPVLARRWIPAGLAFGVGVFVVMNWVVVPLSAIRKFPRFTPLDVAENLAAMLVFGLIVAFAASRGERLTRPASAADL